MNRRFFYYIILLSGIFLLGITFQSCHKEIFEETNPSSILKIGTEWDLNDVVFLNDTLGFACGGKRDKCGFIFRTEDGGINWSSYQINADKSVYSLYFRNDSVGYAGCDDLNMYVTRNSGKSWELFWFGNDVPVNEVDRPAIKRFCFRDSLRGYFVGGENYSIGVVYNTSNGGKSWSFKKLDHELKGITCNAESNIFISGFGYAARSDDFGSSYNQMKIAGDFYVSIESVFENKLIAAGNNGGIYKSYDNGLNWVTKLKPNSVFESRTAFNDMAFSNDLHGIAVGNYGRYSITSNGGESWSNFWLEDNKHLFSVCACTNKIYIASEKGTIYVLSIGY